MPPVSAIAAAYHANMHTSCSSSGHSQFSLSTSSNKPSSKVIHFAVELLRLWTTVEAPLPPTHPQYKTFCHDPKQDMNEYIPQLLARADCPNECVPVAMLYLHRILSRPNTLLTSNNVHRLFVVCMMLASKWLEDATLRTRDWARISGFPEAMLVRMEREFLRILQFDLYVNDEEYLAFVAQGKAQIFMTESSGHSMSV